jgi:hypothetical protein
MSDTEISQNIVNLINSYFNIDNWDFGETFYFSELASYIHNNMVGQVAQITIEPINNSSVNNLLEIRLNSDEMFMPVVKTNNIVVKNNLIYNPTVLASNNGANIQ